MLRQLCAGFSPFWFLAAAQAGTVTFDPPVAYPSTPSGLALFDISISQNDLASFDTVSMVFTYDPTELDLQFSYAPSFLSLATLPPATPAEFCGDVFCHLLVGGNRFGLPGWDAPLLVGVLRAYVVGNWSYRGPARDILVSTSAEEELIGVPLSLLAYRTDQESLQGLGRVFPEPSALTLLFAAGAAAFGPRRRFHS